MPLMTIFIHFGAHFMRKVWGEKLWRPNLPVPKPKEEKKTALIWIPKIETKIKAFPTAKAKDP